MKKKIFTYGLSGWLIATALILVFSPAWLAAAELQAVKLNPPDLKRGLPFMEALAVKASAREFSEKELSLQDLSDLLWAADGINRPAENKSTASSAMNAHDIRIYVFMKQGAYLYDAPKHELLPVLAGDFRSQLMMARPPRPAAVPAAPADAAAPRRRRLHLSRRPRPILRSRSSWSPTRNALRAATPRGSSNGGPWTPASSRRTSRCSAPPPA